MKKNVKIFDSKTKPQRIKNRRKEYEEKQK